MSNVFGSAGPKIPNNIRERIRDRLHLTPWTAHERYDYEWLYLDCSYPAHAAPTKTVTVASTTLLILGEVYADGQSGEKAAQAILDAYRRGGKQILNDFNGNYTLVLWDSEQRQLLIANDVLGLHALYYTNDSDAFQFSTKIAPLLLDPDLDRSLDPYGINDLLTLGWFTLDRTLFRNIRRMRPGSILEYRDGRLNVARNRTPEFSASGWGRSIYDFADEMYETLTEAFRIRSKSTGRTLIPLSGGLDSRLIAGFWNRATGGDFDTFTYGAPYHADLLVARKIARQLGVKHSRGPFRRDYIDRYMSDHLKLVEAMTDFTTAQLFPIVEHARNQYRRIVLGTFGGPSSGSSIGELGFEKKETMESAFGEFLKWAIDSDHETIRTIYADNMPGDISRSVEEALRSVFGECESAVEPFQKVCYANWVGKQRGFIGAHDMTCNATADVVSPFLDGPYRRLMCSAPMAMLQNQLVFRLMLQRHFPDLARIVSSNDDRPISNDRAALANLYRYLAFKMPISMAAKIVTRLRGRHSTGVVTSMWDTMSHPDHRIVVGYLERMLSNASLWDGFLRPEAVRKIREEYERSNGLKYRVLARRLAGLFLYLDEISEM